MRRGYIYSFDFISFILIELVQPAARPSGWGADFDENCTASPRQCVDECVTLTLSCDGGELSGNIFIHDQT